MWLFVHPEYFKHEVVHHEITILHTQPIDTKKHATYLVQHNLISLLSQGIYFTDWTISLLDDACFYKKNTEKLNKNKKNKSATLLIQWNEF